MVEEPLVKPRYCVAKSKIQGQGVFTNVELHPGELVGCMEWEVLPRGAAYTRHDIHIRGRWHRVRNWFRYLNHSSEPTVEVGDDGAVCALKYLDAGTELTFDYGEGWER